MHITFDVNGVPAPQGSKTAVVRNGKAHVIEGGSSVGRAKNSSWRADVAAEAKFVASGLGAPIDEPVRLTVTFRLPMPRSRPKRLQAAGVNPCSVKPDLDKLVRSTNDALVTSGLLRDDSLIYEIEATKLEVVGWTGATITITTTSGNQEAA